MGVLLGPVLLERPNVVSEGHEEWKHNVVRITLGRSTEVGARDRDRDPCRVAVIEPAEVAGARDVDQPLPASQRGHGLGQREHRDESVLVEVVVGDVRSVHFELGMVEVVERDLGREIGASISGVCAPGQCESVRTVPDCADPSTTTCGVSVSSEYER